MANNKKKMNVDEMLAHVGDFGTFQWMLMFLFSFINVLSAFHYFGQTFISIVPDHKCSITADDPQDIIQHPCQKLYFDETAQQYLETDCDRWQYNSSYGYVSIVQQLNWVCKDDWKPALGQSVFFLGSVFGSLLFGVLADRIGRLHVLVISNLLAFSGNACTLFSKTETSFAISRFVAGSATDTNFVMMYIIVMEYMRPSLRTFALNLCIGVFYCIACMAVPWAAVYCGTWRIFLVIVSVPHSLVVGYYFIVPESAQWLLSKGHIDKALRCFKHIAHMNKTEVTNEAAEQLKLYAKDHIKNDGNNVSVIGLFQTPKLRRKTFILIFKSMVITLCYDAISRNVNGLGYSPFMVFTMSSATILPACVFILMVQDKIGRKALASGSLLLSGIFTLFSGVLVALVIKPDKLIASLLNIIARFGINIAYNSGCQYAVELIPTEVRGQGVSLIHVAGYAASFFSPYILYLSNYWEPAPSMIIAILLICGSASCLLLPETLDKSLPVTLQDGELFGEDEKIFNFACCRSKSILDEEVYNDGVLN